MANSYWVGSNVAVRNDYEVYLSQTVVSWEELFQLYPISNMQAWGINSNYILGNGTTTGVSTPISIGTNQKWKQVAPTLYWTHAISSTNNLWAWGTSAAVGGLGNGNANDTFTTPVQIGSDTTWLTLSSSYTHVLALKNNNSLWVWGQGTSGELGLGATSSVYAPTNLSSQGNVWISCSAGHSYSLAITASGSLYSWGTNNSGQLGLGNTTNTSTPVQIGGQQWLQVAASPDYTNPHTLAIRRDGTLWAWGDNTWGQLGDGTTAAKSSPIQVGSESTWSKIANGGWYSVALKSDGSLWAWGSNLMGNIGNGTWGNNYSIPQQVGNLTNWRSISARYFSTYAVKQDGSLWSWGYGAQGQLGDGQSGGSYATSSPQQVGTLTNWKTVTGGYQYAMAVAWPTAPNS